MKEHICFGLLALSSAVPRVCRSCSVSHLPVRLLELISARLVPIVRPVGGHWYRQRSGLHVSLNVPNNTFGVHIPSLFPWWQKLYVQVDVPCASCVMVRNEGNVPLRVQSGEMCSQQTTNLSTAPINYMSKIHLQLDGSLFLFKGSLSGCQ